MSEKISYESFDDYISAFFWDFKRMDNISYNFDIVEILCNIKNINNEKKLNKPISLLLVSIIETILFDFIKRVQEHVHEKIDDLCINKINATKSAKLEKFDAIISHIKKHAYLGDDSIYVNLKTLSDLRNHVHIHKKRDNCKRDEANLWTDEQLILAGSTLCDVTYRLAITYPRARDGSSISEIKSSLKPWVTKV